jgi:hypothetical protein
VALRAVSDYQYFKQIKAIKILPYVVKCAPFFLYKKVGMDKNAVLRVSYEFCSGLRRKKSQ